MSYRDALDAALARVADLEAKLAALGRTETTSNPEVAELRAERDRFADLARTLQERLDALRASLAKPRPGLRTVYEHNRERPPHTGKRVAGVLCPVCHDFGEKVEMLIGGGVHVGELLAPVLCPRCGFGAHVRKD